MSKQKQGRKAFLPKWAIFIIILAFILTAGIIGVVIYYIFNYVNYSNGNGGGLFDGQKIKIIQCQMKKDIYKASMQKQLLKTIFN